MSDPMDEDISPRPEEENPAAPAGLPGGSTHAPPLPSTTGPPSSAPTGSHAHSKRKRGLGIVTPNACTECRKKRAKCDGHKPCGRCQSQDVNCVYETPVKQSKENLRSEIEQLRRQQRTNETVFAALMRPELGEDVLSRLRAGQSVDNISDSLAVPLPSRGGGTQSPMIGRPGEQQRPTPASAAPLPGFSGTAANFYVPIGVGVGTASPVTSGAQQSMRQCDSPWGHFSSHSQTISSTGSNSHPDLMNWTSDSSMGPPQSRVGTWVESLAQDPETPRSRGPEQVLTPDFPRMNVPPDHWTRVTPDAFLVQHLLALYFCWEYPTFASLSKEHFLRDFREGRSRYCSSILVNALLALGCRFSQKPNTRANPNNPYTSGDHFFKECQRLFYLEEDHHSLTTIQALGIMSIREASCGRDSESWYYAGQSVRLAIELGLHRFNGDGLDQDETAVRAATFWGAFALDHAWSLATGSLPQCSLFPRLPPKPAIIDDVEASLWLPYTDDGAPLQRSCEQPSNVRSVYTCFCELSELVHQSLYVLHSPGRPLTSRDLLSTYTQYINWYDGIPEVLRLGHNFTPAVLFAHMYYHFAILLLFRPLIKLRILGSSVAPRDVCSQAADAIQGLLQSYSNLYTLRRTPSFVPYFVLTSTIMHLAIGASESDRTPTKEEPDPHETAHSPTPNMKANSKMVHVVKRGIADLTEMAPCHHFAEQALNILRYLAKKWQIDVDMGPTQEHLGKAGFATENLDPDDPDRSVGPRTDSLNFFIPHASESHYSNSWPLPGPVKSGKGPGPVAQAANTMDNPLFWPFPMQGRPMLPSGAELEQAGFAFL